MTTETTSSVSQYAHLYLGDVEADPAPVFRDLSPEGVRLPDGTLVAWPEGAVFAVYFARERFSLAMKFDAGSVVGGCEYYDVAGWPLELSAALKTSLGNEMRCEFQVYPWGWRTFSAGGWRKAHRAPQRFRFSRFQSAVVHDLAPFVPSPRVTAH